MTAAVVGVSNHAVTALCVFESCKEVAGAAKQSATASMGMLESRRVVVRMNLAQGRVVVEPRLEHRLNNSKDVVMFDRSDRKVRSGDQDTGG